MKKEEYSGERNIPWRFFLNVALALLCSVFLWPRTAVAAEEAPGLQALIEEALKNNREVRAAEAKWNASTYRVPQAESLPDPMVMFGYQNEGWNRYTYGQMQGSQWMYSVSQTFPFPGKRSLKGEMAAREAESYAATYEAVRLRVAASVRQLYYDLFLAYKTSDLIQDKTALFTRIEDAALARYSAGMGTQQEVLMAQTEKYMLLEKETVLRQKMESLQAMLNNAIGREANASLGRPATPERSTFGYTADELLALAYEQSPEIRSREKIKDSSKAQISLSQKDYYPDLTLAGSVYQRRGDFEDMWSLTATINIPLYFRKKQSAVAEAKALSYQTESELEAVKLMLSSTIRDNFSLLTTSEKLMDLYRLGLIPKTYQDFELALSGYRTGKVEAITVINRLKALLDYETLYWGQFVEREKAVARLQSIAGIADPKTVVIKNEH